ncbi:MAG: hypothetical protein FWG61_08290 [Firmicutes bacterium]|nr:hypothetical protein [Bacillota bacterium]
MAKEGKQKKTKAPKSKKAQPEEQKQPQGTKEKKGILPKLKKGTPQPGEGTTAPDQEEASEGGKKKKLQLPKAILAKKGDNAEKKEQKKQDKQEKKATKEKAKETKKQVKAKKKEDKKKPGQDKKTQTGKGGKVTVKKRGFPIVLVLLAFFVALLLVAGVMFYFNILSWRDKTLNAADNLLVALDPDYKHYSEALNRREQELNTLEEDVRQREEALQQSENTLADESDRLEKRAAALDKREKQFNDQQTNTVPLYRQEIDEEKLLELKNLGKIYSNMEKTAAAQALSLLDTPIEMAEVIYYMDKKAAADLLAALTPELAAQITSEMLREY